MLKPLPAAPAGELRDIPKQNAQLNRITEDAGDLRMFTSADGKTKYLRVWVGDPKRASQAEAPTTGPQWYEVVTVPAEAVAATADEVK